MVVIGVISHLLRKGDASVFTSLAACGSVPNRPAKIEVLGHLSNLIQLSKPAANRQYPALCSRRQLLYDNGVTNGDVAADDDVFTDDGVNLYAPPPGGVVDFYVRAGVATDDGPAAFADFHCTFGEIYGLILADDFEAGGISAWSGSAP